MVGFSEEWDERYKENSHLSIWPWSDVVSLVLRHIKPQPPKFKVLELGCGAGANIPFFNSFGFVDYYGVDGSSSIIKKLQEKHPSLQKQLVVEDFTEDISFDEKFDLILDRGSLTCNSTKAISNTLGIVYDKLNENGKFLSIDMYSINCSEYEKGELDEDKNTRKNFQSGPFEGVGCVHFSDKDHLIDLFKKFEIIYLEHKIHYTEIPEQSFNFASWNVLAQKI